MRRFESTPFLRLQMPGGRRLDAWLAESFAARLLGLAFAAGLPDGRALLLPRCRSVHTVAMRFAIDIAFLDSELRVLAVSPGVRPWRLRLQRGARAVLELPAGEADRVGIAPGDQLTVECSATNDEKEKAHVLA